MNKIQNIYFLLLYLTAINIYDSVTICTNIYLNYWRSLNEQNRINETNSAKHDL